MVTVYEEEERIETSQRRGENEGCVFLVVYVRMCVCKMERVDGRFVSFVCHSSQNQDLMKKFCNKLLKIPIKYPCFFIDSHGLLYYTDVKLAYYVKNNDEGYSKSNIIF